MKKWRLRVGNGFTTGHIVIWLLRQDTDVSLGFSPNTHLCIHQNLVNMYLQIRWIQCSTCPQGVRELNQGLYCNWWNYGGEHRGCQNAEEKRPSPGRREEGGSGESPGEDMNGHWLDTKGGREGSRQENCMNTSMDSTENMGHVSDEEESPRG